MTGDLHPITDEPVCLLMDNGSLKAEAILNLRIIAGKLSKLTQRIIRPVSLLYSNEIDSAQLGGNSAEIFEPTINTLALRKAI